MKDNKVKCDKCGINLTYKGISRIALVVDFPQLYLPRHKRRVYNFCGSCYLENLGIKPTISLKRKELE